MIAEICIIPKPARLIDLGGVFVTGPNLSIRTPAGDVAAAVLATRWAAEAGMAIGISLAWSASAPDGTGILLETASDVVPGPEAYRMQITPERILIQARAPAGWFYGLQSLRQLLHVAMVDAGMGERLSLPCIEVEDAPRFAWRGMMLDVCRHFIPVSDVKKFIDYLALYKLNRFHWHLTEDQGWRIEIKKYPKLTKIGAWRKESLIGHFKDTPARYDGIPHGGFYTQDDIREVVRYAADRFITVVPEIEMPGHAQAALAAYPEFGVTWEPVEVRTTWGISPIIYNPSEKTIAFLQDVLEEVLALFPSPFICIGGDEALKDQWKASPTVQAQIKELGLKDEDELQSWFIRRMETFLNARGRRLLGWDEILEGGLAPNATVMSWRGVEPGIEAAKLGHDVIMCPRTHCYFDHYQAGPEGEPLAIGGLTTLEKAYGYEPIPEGLPPEHAHLVLGAQANVWTEYMPDFRHVQYMIFPRITALAEAVWSPAGPRDYPEFLSRVRAHEVIYQRFGLRYAPHVFSSARTIGLSHHPNPLPRERANVNLSGV
ncbi:MAG TPA: beta-N-acetylhexosaminidase [Kiritimatiellia bacterium]|nr:beta-N-acetylhexosaminidase [Kiritimatiellia bacterium]